MDYSLTVNSAPFDLRAAGVEPAALLVSVDGPRELTLVQRDATAAGCCRVPAPALPLWAAVELSVDGAVRFAGRVLRRTVARTERGVEIVFACGDGRALARLVTAVDEFGEPRLAYNVEPNHADADPARHNMPVGAIVADLLSRHQAELAALGAAPAAGPAYRAAEPAALPPLAVEVSATNVDVAGAIEQALGPVPGAFAWFDPASRQWRLGTSAASPTIDVPIDAGAVESLSLSDAAYPCWTAVEAFGPPPSGRKSRGLQMVRLSTGGLLADWDAALEPTWTRDKAAISDPALDDLPPAQQAALAEALRLNLADNPFAWVYRRFRIGNFTGPAGMTRVQLWQRINPTDQADPRWQPVRTHFDRATGRAVAAVPLLARGNPRVPGAAKIAYDVALTFRRRIPGDAEPATTVRVPAVGHSGTAAAAGVLTTRRVYLSRLTTERAATIAPLIAAEHADRRDLTVEGELTIAADAAGIDALFEPGRRLRLRRSDGSPVPAVESAFVRSAELIFGPPAKWRVKLG